MTTVTVDDVRGWLASRGVKTGFFFPDATDAPDYLNPQHPCYAPGLAVAVNAWVAVTQGSGKSVKDAIKKCLREHAAEFDLANEDGNPNETGIDEVAKVANWQPTGGASKTPASNLPPGSPATIGYARVAHPNPPPSAKIYAPFGL